MLSSQQQAHTYPTLWRQNGHVTASLHGNRRYLDTSRLVTGDTQCIRVTNSRRIGSSDMTLLLTRNKVHYSYLLTYLLTYSKLHDY